MPFASAALAAAVAMPLPTTEASFVPPGLRERDRLFSGGSLSRNHGGNRVEQVMPVFSGRQAERLAQGPSDVALKPHDREICEAALKFSSRRFRLVRFAILCDPVSSHAPT
jgi:hypothetical protein